MPTHHDLSKRRLKGGNEQLSRKGRDVQARLAMSTPKPRRGSFWRRRPVGSQERSGARFYLRCVLFVGAIYAVLMGVLDCEQKWVPASVAGLEIRILDWEGCKLPEWGGGR